MHCGFGLSENCIVAYMDEVQPSKSLKISKNLEKKLFFICFSLKKIKFAVFFVLLDFKK